MQTKSIWTNEEIGILKQHGSNLSAAELQQYLPNRTVESIGHKFKRLKIGKTKEFFSNNGKKYLVEKRKPEYQYYKLDQTFTLQDLDNATYQVLIGSILGDGGVSKHSTGKGYLFKETHGTAQKDYLEWKRGMFAKFCPCKISGKKPTFSTPCHPIFKQIREDFYSEKEGRKRFIPLKYIDKLDELGLLIWFLDDGFRSDRRFLISSALFSEHDLNNTINVLNTNLELNLYVRKHMNKFSENWLDMKSICFPPDSRNKIVLNWLNLFEKYEIPNCMKYKVQMRNIIENKWKKEELDLLLYTNKTISELSSILNRTIRAISNKRYELKITRKHKKTNSKINLAIS